MATYAALGVPIRLEAGDVRLRSLASRCLLHADPPRTETPLLLRIDAWSEMNGPLPSAAAFGIDGPRLTVASPSGTGWADQSSGEGFAIVHLSEEASHEIQSTIVETVLLFLAFGRRPIVVHAAAVAYDDVCILITGNEGAGKSTLTYACLRAGMQLVSDDVVYFSSIDQLDWAWGHPISLYLMPDAPLLFPELADASVIARLNGERKIRLDTAARFPGALQAGGPVRGIVAVRHVPGAAVAIRPVDPLSVTAALGGFKGSTAADSPSTMEAARRLSGLPAILLETGDDPDKAAELLLDWIKGFQTYT